MPHIHAHLDYYITYTMVDCSNEEKELKAAFWDAKKKIWQKRQANKSANAKRTKGDKGNYQRKLVKDSIEDSKVPAAGNPMDDHKDPPKMPKPELPETLRTNTNNNVNQPEVKPEKNEKGFKQQIPDNRELRINKIYWTQGPAVVKMKNIDGHERKYYPLEEFDFNEMWPLVNDKWDGMQMIFPWFQTIHSITKWWPVASLVIGTFQEELRTILRYLLTPNYGWRFLSANNFQRDTDNRSVLDSYTAIIITNEHITNMRRINFATGQATHHHITTHYALEIIKRFRGRDSIPTREQMIVVINQLSSVNISLENPCLLDTLLYCQEMLIKDRVLSFDNDFHFILNR